MMQFWFSKYVWSVKYTFILNMSQILDIIYTWVFFVNNVFSVFLLFFFFFLHFWRLKTLVLWQKIIQNFPILVYLLCRKNSKNDSAIRFIIFWDFSMFYQIFLAAQMKRCAIIDYKHGIYELPHELPNDLRLRILGN